MVDEKRGRSCGDFAEARTRTDREGGDNARKGYEQLFEALGGATRGFERSEMPKTRWPDSADTSRITMIADVNARA